MPFLLNANAEHDVVFDHDVLLVLRRVDSRHHRPITTLQSACVMRSMVDPSEPPWAMQSLAGMSSEWLCATECGFKLRDSAGRPEMVRCLFTASSKAGRSRRCHVRLELVSEAVTTGVAADDPRYLTYFHVFKRLLTFLQGFPLNFVKRHAKRQHSLNPYLSL
jgi:hypothetical protein